MSQTVSRKISSNRAVRSLRSQMSSLREIRFAQTSVCVVKNIILRSTAKSIYYYYRFCDREGNIPQIVAYL